jgi:hypothetical protein
VPKSNKYRCIFKTFSTLLQVIFNKLFKYCFPFPCWADSALYKINNTVMPILLAGTVEFVHIEQVSTLDKFYCNNINTLYFRHPVLYVICGSIVVEALCYKLEGHRFEPWWGEWMVSIYLILPTALGPWVYSVLTEMSTRIRKKNLWGVEYGWCIRLTTLPPSMSQLCRQCGVLNISQPYRPPRPVMGITLLYFTLLSF